MLLALFSFLLHSHRSKLRCATRGREKRRVLDNGGGDAAIFSFSSGGTSSERPGGCPSVEVSTVDRSMIFLPRCACDLKRQDRPAFFSTLSLFPFPLLVVCVYGEGGPSTCTLLCDWKQCGVSNHWIITFPISTLGVIQT